MDNQNTTNAVESPQLRTEAIHLKTIWLKAATIGSVWAALEIVLGSFLHNMRIPMSGTILAACGVVLLTASQMIWREPGLIWRAGVICAIMKSVSPSAVIFGPMIGILTEALVVQGAVILFGRNYLGLLIGGMLALLEPAIHRIGSWIIEYGLSFGTLYLRLYEFVARVLHVESFGPFDLVFAYFALNMLIGLMAVFAGLVIARQALNVPVSTLKADSRKPVMGLTQNSITTVYHPFLLIAHFAVMIGGFLLIRQIPAWQSALFVVIYCALCLRNYVNIRRVFRKPKLWIELLLVGVLASLLLGNLTGSESGWSWSGLEAGLQMMIRAILVIIAFASIGTELRNPRIVDWFLRRKWGTLSAATNLAFEALPTMMAALSEQKQIIRHPLQSISIVLATGIHWLAERSEEISTRSRVFVITGQQGKGKTTRLTELVEVLKAAGEPVGGILAPVVYENGQRIGYDIVSIATGERRVLCRTTGVSPAITAGRYRFEESAIAFGEAVIAEARESHKRLIILDEIGPLELAGKGWSHALDGMFSERSVCTILSIRPQLIQDVEHRWRFTPHAIWQSNHITPADMQQDLNDMRGKESV